MKRLLFLITCVLALCSTFASAYELRMAVGLKNSLDHNKRKGNRVNYFKFDRCRIVILSAFFVLLPVYSIAAQGVIIDHTCTDISKIPDSWINQVKSALKIHYAHTSHGEQLMEGSSRLMAVNAKYNYYPDNCHVPITSEYMSLMDGQHYDGYCETYVTPDLYWEGTPGLNITRSVLNSFDVNISMWAWCSQLDYYTEQEVQLYLNNMAQLESEYPGVTFVYMTGNAQGFEQNRYDRNNQIREFCRQNNKILFDFADLDSWYNGQQYKVEGIPMEHPHYNGDEAAHTTFESCENKAKAFWWLLARIAGWEGPNAAAPGAPTLTVTSAGISVILTWTVVSGATGYTLFYAPYPYMGPETIQSIDMGGETYVSVDLWEGASFYVAIQASNSVGSSGYSNIELFSIP